MRNSAVEVVAAATSPAAEAATATATVAPATTTAAKAATATTAAAEAATATTTTAATAARPIVGFVDAQGTPAEQGAIKLLDGGLGQIDGAHCDKGEAARSTCIAIHREVNVTYLTDSLKRRTNIVCRCTERQVSHIQSLTHGVYLFRLHVPARVYVRTLPSPVERSPARWARDGAFSFASTRRVARVPSPEKSFVFVRNET